MHETCTDARSSRHQLEVLSYYLDEACSIDAEDHDLLCHTTIGCAFQTRNQEFVALALEAYHKTNEFRITIYPMSAGPTLSYPPKLYHGFLRRLVISVRDCETGRTLPDMLLSHRSG